ncbi:MAG: DUF1579 domain-containing protein [Bacteroidetes bacterium]|nr:DUF1579 domain-containing protein [Bacteroidota bacterium]
MKKHFVIVSFLICMGSAKLFAQDMNAMQDYMTPGDVHKMIAKYDGTWNSAVSVWMQPGAAPMESKSVAVYTMILGGRYQQGKMTGDYGGMPFEGFSLLGYDNTKKIFTSTWVDNFGTGTMTLEGTWDGASKTITFRGKMFDPMSNKDIDVKETIQYVDDNTIKNQMFVESASGEMKTMEIISTRTK